MTIVDKILALEERVEELESRIAELSNQEPEARVESSGKNLMEAINTRTEKIG